MSRKDLPRPHQCLLDASRQHIPELLIAAAEDVYSVEEFGVIIADTRGNVGKACLEAGPEDRRVRHQDAVLVAISLARMAHLLASRLGPAFFDDLGRDDLPVCVVDRYGRPVITLLSLRALFGTVPQEPPGRR